MEFSRDITELRRNEAALPPLAGLLTGKERSFEEDERVVAPMGSAIEVKRGNRNGENPDDRTRRNQERRRSRGLVVHLDLIPRSSTSPLRSALEHFNPATMTQKDARRLSDELVGAGYDPFEAIMVTAPFLNDSILKQNPEWGYAPAPIKGWAALVAYHEDVLETSGRNGPVDASQWRQSESVRRQIGVLNIARDIQNFAETPDKNPSEIRAEPRYAAPAR